VDFVIERLGDLYGVPAPSQRLDPVSELVLTILSQNTADLNSERAFEALRASYPSGGPVTTHRVSRPDGTEAPPEGWGGLGLAPGAPPNWSAVESADIGALIDVIRIGGLANQKAPRIQAALRTIRERSGGYDLAFLAALPPRDARDWLTAIPGIGRKTASIVLLFCFGMPLMPVDTHVERVSRRIGLAPLASGPDEQHEIYANARPVLRRPRPADPARSPDVRRPPARLRPLPDRPSLPLLRPEGRLAAAVGCVAPTPASRARAWAILRAC
jgi:endonuclease-3